MQCQQVGIKNLLLRVHLHARGRNDPQGPTSDALDERRSAHCDEKVEHSKSSVDAGNLGGVGNACRTYGSAQGKLRSREHPRRRGFATNQRGEALEQGSNCLCKMDDLSACAERKRERAREASAPDDSDAVPLSSGGNDEDDNKTFTVARCR